MHLYLGISEMVYRPSLLDPIGVARVYKEEKQHLALDKHFDVPNDAVV